MDPIDIMATLRKCSSSQAAVARDLGIRTQSVNDVVRGKCRSRRVERAIAAHTSLSLHTLWPQYYGRGDKPRAVA